MDEFFNHTFDVKWTNRDESFASIIGQMYADEEQFDLIIKLDGDQQLLAHRHVMAILSTEIKKVLEGQLNPNGCFVTETSEGKVSVCVYKNRLQIDKKPYKKVH